MTDADAKLITLSALLSNGARVLQAIRSNLVDENGKYRVWMYSRDRRVIRACLDALLSRAEFQGILKNDIKVVVPFFSGAPIEIGYRGMWMSNFEPRQSLALGL